MTARVIDASRISPKLWQGSAPKVEDDLSPFALVILCAAEYQPALRATGLLSCPLDDARLTDVEARRACEAARAAAVVIAGGGRVLVTCWQGLNRSGLVSALTLARLTGSSGRECARHVRSARVGALQNTSFLAFLDQIPRHQNLKEHPGVPVILPARTRSQ